MRAHLRRDLNPMRCVSAKIYDWTRPFETKSDSRARLMRLHFEKSDQHVRMPQVRPVEALVTVWKLQGYRISTDGEREH